MNNFDQEPQIPVLGESKQLSAATDVSTTQLIREAGNSQRAVDLARKQLDKTDTMVQQR